MEKMTGKEMEDIEFDEMFGNGEYKDVNAEAHYEQMLTMIDALNELSRDAKARGITRPEDLNWNGMLYCFENLYKNALSMKAYLEQKQKETEHKATR